MSKRTKLLLLAVYSLLMLWLLFGQRIGPGSEGILQLQPLHTLRWFLWVLNNSADPGLRTHAWVNLIGNVVMFVPLGFFIPWIWRFWRKFWPHLLLMAVVIVLVELSQYCFRLGTCDVDDLLLNVAGTSVGYLLYKLWIRFERRIYPGTSGNSASE